MKQRIATILIALCMSLATSCGSTPSTAPAITAGKPLTRPVTRIAGDVEARDGDTWGPLTAPRTGVVELRSAHGAALAVGDPTAPIAKLWLAPGAHAAIAEDAAGRLRVRPIEGLVRVRAIDARVDATFGASIVALAGRDVLLRVKDGAPLVVDTAAHPDLAAWSFAIGQSDPVGVGSLETKDLAGTVGRLALRTLSVDAKSAGDLVEASVEHVFHNGSDQQLEGTFRFPLPEGAMLTGLAMQIGDKLVEGELVERDKARKVYESIVDSMRDPALLEWEHGTTFKLRVFPIEPKSDKRVVIRFVSKVRAGLSGPEWVLPMRAPGSTTLERFRVAFDGKTVLDEKPWSPPGQVVVPVATANAIHRETTAEGVFVRVTVAPDWSKVAAPPAAPGRRRVFVVVDTSRSMLEERALALDALKATLDELRPEDRVAVITSDVDARGGDLEPATNDAVARAIASVSAVEPDGASDLAGALTFVGAKIAAARASDPSDDLEVVYVGDGAPTWGETDPAAIQKLGVEKLGAVRFHAMLLGQGGDDAAVRALAAATSGLVTVPRTKLELARDATKIARARSLKRLSHARVVAGAGAAVLPLGERTLYEGETLEVAVRFANGAVPSSIALVADAYEQRVPLSGLVEAKHVARTFGALQLAALEASGADKEQLVKTSLAYGVASKHTSWLVLESEEAYAQWQIARKAKAQADDGPKVSGSDLESIGGKTTMTPDHLQPGDPELHVKAPADALSVVAVLPSGETKVATFEPDSSLWTVRFLVESDVPDGTYEIVVRITHADGTVELRKVPFHVDTKAPTFAVSLRKVDSGYEIRADQRITDDEVRSMFPSSTASPASLKETQAHILTDAKRVEVSTPDGQTLTLNGVKLGSFRGIWKPKAPLGAKVVLHVVGVDRALNTRAFDVEVSP